MTTALAEKIKALIQTSGPISVTDYFALCLADPQHGYYQTRNPFGSLGDFVTAPEVSQLFGEMIGVFVVHAWQNHGKPLPVCLVEVGPGRGTMMSDMLRVIARVAPDLFEGASVHLVETSDRLQDVQKKTLESYGDKVRWHKGFDELPEGFTLLVANELFDAIPIRQFVKTPTGFRERMVGLDANDNLAFTVGVATLDPDFLKDFETLPADGAIFEISPARLSVMQVICERMAAFGGTSLVIDYGHLTTGFGDTLQAVLAHEYDPPLAHPGMADLTSHVDFEQLARAATALGMQINGLLPQGDFLKGLGLLERAAALAKEKPEDTQHEIALAVDRLSGSGQGKMGELFKVLAFSSPPVKLMPFRSGN
ncbi:SAM-dependent methyltransferase [Ciceribacter sp. L1K22]|uniref:class I SAM-dependent methyltransferase n=1 Tax=Ciceribacter sp. L1K22 TaxID=2820275 RepID=UPI001ABDCB75|nr:class I SAM-dependent methyltransferase [Ciceribacter sp. L1K22]